MNISGPFGLNAKVNGLRRPSAQMARFRPVAVLKNGLSVGNGAVAVEAEHLAEQVRQRLRVGAVGVLADRRVELPVGAEGERAAVVVRGAAEVVEIEDHDLAAGLGDVAVRGEAADAIVNSRRGRRVIDIHEADSAANAGSKATPSRPRSPDAFTVSVTNGVGSSAPSLITRSRPPCSQTNRRPSGANCMAVGLARPLATCDSVNPAGSVAAAAGVRAAAPIASTTPMTCTM